MDEVNTSSSITQVDDGLSVDSWATNFQFDDEPTTLVSLVLNHCDNNKPDEGIDGWKGINYSKQ